MPRGDTAHRSARLSPLTSARKRRELPVIQGSASARPAASQGVDASIPCGPENAHTTPSRATWHSSTRPSPLRSPRRPSGAGGGPLEESLWPQVGPGPGSLHRARAARPPCPAPAKVGAPVAIDVDERDARRIQGGQPVGRQAVAGARAERRELQHRRGENIAPRLEHWNHVTRDAERVVRTNVTDPVVKEDDAVSRLRDRVDVPRRRDIRAHAALLAWRRRLALDERVARSTVERAFPVLPVNVPPHGADDPVERWVVIDHGSRVLVPRAAGRPEDAELVREEGVDVLLVLTKLEVDDRGLGRREQHVVGRMVAEPMPERDEIP
jgi:hypothetical protein